MRAWLALLILLPLASAESQAPQHQDFGDEFGCGEVTFDNVASRSISYSSCALGTGVEVMQMFVSVAGAVQLHMEGFSAQGSPDGGAAAAFELDLDIRQVVEFVDDGDGKFVPETDQIVRQHALNAWSDIRTSELDGGIRFETDHAIGNGTFTLGGVARGNFMANGIEVQSLDTKMDFNFQDYDYQHEESQLALVLRVSSAGFAAAGNFRSGGEVVQDLEAGVVGSQGPTSLYFTWAKAADVDGTPRGVTSHVAIEQNPASDGEVSSQRHAGITLAYARGSDIVHDPRMGVQFHAGNESPGLPTGLLLAGLVAVALVRQPWSTSRPV